MRVKAAISQDTGRATSTTSSVKAIATAIKILTMVHGFQSGAVPSSSGRLPLASAGCDSVAPPPRWSVTCPADMPSSLI